MVNARLLAAAALAVCAVALLAAPASAGIYTKPIEIDPNYMEIWRVGMWTVEEAPAGDSQSFVDIDLKFAKPQGNDGTGEVDVVLFHYENMDLIGYNGEQDYVCCTQDLVDNNYCYFPGRIIVDSSSESLYLHYVLFDEQSVETANGAPTLKAHHDIEKSGIYYLYIVNCREAETGPITIEGQIEFKNPYGYLPGELYRKLPFYGVMALIYVFIGFFWLFLSAKHYRKLLKLQNAIAGIILLGMIESATWYFDLLSFNISGVNHMGAIITGIFASSIKMTASLTLVLLVSMGYGVVKPTVGATKYRIALLAVVYFFFTFILRIAERLQQSNVVWWTTFLIFPVALCDTIFYGWTFLSLVRTINQLSVRKQTAKLVMYKRFFTTLVLSAVAVGIALLVELYLAASTIPDELWATEWIWPCFYDVLYFVVLLAIIILWRPTSNNTRYEYSELNLVEEEIDLPSVSTIGADTKKRRGDESDAEGSAAGSDREYTSDREDGAKKDDGAATFTIDEEERPDVKME